MRTSFSLTLSALALGLLTAACGSSNALAPQWQPQVTNTPNVKFAFQATGLTDVTDVVSYNWSCSSGNVIIHPATTTTSGTILLTIKDGGGVVRYNGDVPPSGDIDLATFAGGTWNIKVTLTNYSGTINFEVQQQ
jgi:hypothetical protein